MSYRDFYQKMHMVSQQTKRAKNFLAADYQRLVEILEAHPDDAKGAEKALWAEYDQTQNVFFPAKGMGCPT